MNFSTNEIIKDPNTKTTMYRVLETNSERNQLRLVRTGKDGSIHGLVKKTEGEWVPASEFENFRVIGTFSGTDAKRNLKNKAKGTMTKTNAVGPKHNARPSISSHPDIYQLLENFQKSKVALAEGLRELVG